MKQLFLATVVVVLASNAPARIGDTPEQLQQRYGPPLKQSFDREKYGLATYKSGGFNEIRVTFVKGRSKLERYKVAGDESTSEAVVETLKQENPGEMVLPLSDHIQVGTEEPEAELKFVTRSGQEHSYSGTARYRNDKEDRILVVHNNETVIEIPFQRNDPALKDLKPNTTYACRRE